MSNGENEARKAVADLSAHAKEVDAKRLKGKIKVVTKDDIKNLIASVIDTYGGLAHKDLIAKISEHELTIQNLQNQLMAARADAEKAASADALQKDLANLRSMMQARDGEIQALEEKLKTLEDALAAANSNSSAKDARIRELEELASSDALAAQIVELQNKMAEMEREYLARIKVLEEHIFELECALEFCDILDELKPEQIADLVSETTAILDDLEGKLASRDDDESKAVLETLPEIRSRIEAVNLDVETFEKLVMEMDDGKGSIAVINEIENLNARDLWAVDDMKRTRAALGLIQSLLN